jgi:hypothetical protein
LVTLVTGCNYRFEGKQSSVFSGTTISVPYIKGDFKGMLTDEVIRQLAASGQFTPVQSDGALLLKVTILSNSNQKIGYRHHRDDTTGRIRKRLMPTEDRCTITAEVMLFDEITDTLLIGPEVVSASGEYDYVDPDSIRELAFIDAQGRERVVLDFSLGQLDSIEGAQDDVAAPVFRALAQKIIDGILNQK